MSSTDTLIRIYAERIDALEARVAALTLAAWDVHEVISDWFDGNGDEDDVRKAWNELGELLPAQRLASTSTAILPGQGVAADEAPVAP